MKKWDFILALIVFSLAGCFLLVSNSAGNAENKKVVITVDGIIYKKMPLKHERLTIENQYGKNIVEVSSDGVLVSEADCGNLQCVHTGKIRTSNQAIACLPHHLFITIEGAEYENQAIDATAR